jgi:transmembrane sensor
MDLKELLDKYLTETLTGEELLEFRQLLRDDAQLPVLESELQELFQNQLKQEQETAFPEADLRIEQYVMQAIHNEKLRGEKVYNGKADEEKTDKVRPLYRWWAAAAVLLLLVTAGGYLLSRRQPDSKPIAAKKQTIQPGRKGAILTLADGRQVELDSLQNGTVAQQGTQTVKVQHGELQYTGANNELAYNTVSTPNGRQFRLTLPDGTKVWLNAGSHIQYPLQFRGKERKVEMAGEAYFEVAPDATMPFMVDVNKEAAIRVLGTGFNINAYNNEDKITATLIEGRIQVSSKEKAIILEPGEQAVIQDGISTAHPDLEQVVAWKNNLFDFEDSDLGDVMRQIERWYDIEVIYTGQQPKFQFTGKISRNMTLENLIKTLEVSGVKCRLEDRKLFVLP